jgi:dynein heavy chain
MSPDELVLSKAAELLSSLPELLLQSEGAKELFTINAQGLIPSFSTVLVQELTKFNNMLGIMSTSLKNLDLAIKGFIVMSSTLDSMYIKIQNNQVPSNWAAYPSLKPLSSWFTDLIKRIDFFRMWLHHGNPPAYWVSGFFFPQGFMTGVLQTHARHYQIAIDKLTFSFSYMDAEGVEDIEEKPEDGVYIYGLFMDGARWDRENQIIADQIPTVMYDRLPVIHFKPQDGYVRDPDEYQAPLYKTSERKGILSTTGLSTNFIDHVSTPSKENPAHWVQRGAALLAMLDD